MSRTLLVTSSKFSSMHQVSGIPEGGDRISFILEHFKKSKIISKCHLIEAEKCDIKFISSNHSLQYISDFRAACESKKSRIDYTSKISKAIYLQNYFKYLVQHIAFEDLTDADRFDFIQLIRKMNRADTPIVADSFDSALTACGAGIQAVTMVLAGKAQNAFVLVRPPGHHAEEDLAMGFCYFNNIAVATHALLDSGLQKIAIIDWDVHHGNGTQHSFYTDARVLVCNIHQEPPFYPGFCGNRDEIGSGKGEGFNLNLPLAAGSGETEYQQAFLKIKDRLDQFKPEFILVSSGFDAHANDPLGAMRLSTEFFGWLSDQILECAERYCQGRLVSFLEGGYNRAMLAECAQIHLQSLLKATQGSSK